MTLMVLSGAGWAVKILATRKLRQRLAVLEHQHALEKERTRIARDIHDELGSLLTGIALVSDHGEKHCDQPGKAERDFHQISETVLDAVQTVDGIVWAVNPRNDSLDSLANYLVHFAENFFRLTPSRCRLDVPALVPHIRVSTHQRHHLLMAVKEAFTNAARHSGATEVWLRLVVKELEISVTVEDNGRGFDPAISRVNQDGLPNMRQRMVDSGGQMELNSSPGHGTRVTFSVPLNHN